MLKLFVYASGWPPKPYNLSKPLPDLLYVRSTLGRYDDLDVLAAARAEVSCASACCTAGPCASRPASVALSIGTMATSSVSDASAVTGDSEPMSRVSAALATRRLLRAVSSASCPLPT